MSRDVSEMELKRLNRPCPLCDSPQGEVVHTQHFVLPENSILKDRYDVVLCPRCGFGFADTPLEQGVYSEYYRSFSIYDHLAPGSLPEIPKPGPLLLKKAEKIRSFLDHSARRILDVGCAKGLLLSALREIGCSSVHGLDPSFRCIELLRNCGIEAFHGDIFHHRPLENVPAFDMVCLSHVLEHLRDLKEVPCCIGKMLNDSGLLYVEVPNAAVYGKYKCAPFYQFNTEHINHFDLFALDHLFRPHGFARIAEGEIGPVAFMQTEDASPFLYAVYRKESPVSSYEIFRTTGIESGILEHLDFSRRSDRYEILDNRAEKEIPLIVWGAGQWTMRLLATTSLGKCRIKFFIDSNHSKQGTSFRGVPVCAPEILGGHSEDILVVSELSSEQIRSQIRDDLKLKNRVFLLCW